MGDGIHSTAVIDPRATLAPGVRVGPWSCVGPDVVLDEEVEIGNHVTLEGRVTLGRGARVGHGSVIGGVPQDLKFKPGTPSGVRIGAGTVIRELVTIHRATKADTWTEIGEGCLVMSSAHVAHDCRIGHGVIVINYAGITGHCEIGDRATVGGLTGLAPFTRVGAFAYIGGCSKVTSDIPPGLLVDGLPATAHGVNVVGLRRGGIPLEERRLLQDAFRILYRSGLAPRRAVERIRNELPSSVWLTRFVEFIAASRRGICKGSRGGDASARDTEGEVVG